MKTDTMSKFYISFGQTHVHRVNGKTFDCDCLCEVEAIDEATARNIAFSAFGQVWGNIYDEAQLSSMLEFFPRGVIAL